MNSTTRNTYLQNTWNHSWNPGVPLVHSLGISVLSHLLIFIVHTVHTWSTVVPLHILQLG